MDEIIYNGKKYTRNTSKWVDADNIVVCQSLQNDLNNLFIRTMDLSKYTTSELIEEGDKFKASGNYSNAINFYEKALENCSEEDSKYILPRITSCYRLKKQPSRAIGLFSGVKEKYGEDFFTGALLTSVAAAYCDLEEYDNALLCCKRAYKLNNGEEDYSLSLVYSRIKKAIGEEDGD